MTLILVNFALPIYPKSEDVQDMLLHIKDLLIQSTCLTNEALALKSLVVQCLQDFQSFKTCTGSMVNYNCNVVHIVLKAQTSRF